MGFDPILIAHTYYQQPGGEDIVFAAETRLLEEFGHRVVRHTAHNDSVRGMSPLALAASTVWSRAAQRDMQALIQREQPRLAHFHNTFVMLSPAIYSTCKAAGLPVVQTLHNYRLICPDALLLRNGRPCHDCVGKHCAWPGVLHACYRNSRPQSAVVAAMLAFHRWRHTWQQQVDLYIALSEFARQQFIAGGLPAEKIVVKPNFAHPDPGQKQAPGDYALFVGRLSPEKGIATLLHAWAHPSLSSVPLKVAGDGPLLPEAHRLVRAHDLRQVHIVGRRPHTEIVALMKNARLLIFPSEWYESFPLTLVETFACGVPVVASRLGSVAEIVEEGRSGLLFAPGSTEELAAHAAWLWQHPAEAQRMGQEARAVFEEKYTAQHNYHMLRTIYEAAMTHAA
jgi:glycosyltransferase involved in cell wall biosynthesis